MSCFTSLPHHQAPSINICWLTVTVSVNNVAGGKNALFFGEQNVWHTQIICSIKDTFKISIYSFFQLLTCTGQNWSHLVKTLHTVSETEVYVNQTVNHFSLLSHKIHSMTTFSKIHELFSHSYSTCKTIYLQHVFKCNTLFPKLLKTHSKQNDGKCRAFLQ